MKGWKKSLHFSGVTFYQNQDENDSDDGDHMYVCGDDVKNDWSEKQKNDMEINQ